MVFSVEIEAAVCRADGMKKKELHECFEQKNVKFFYQMNLYLDWPFILRLLLFRNKEMNFANEAKSRFSIKTQIKFCFVTCSENVGSFTFCRSGPQANVN